MAICLVRPVECESLDRMYDVMSRYVQEELI